jgi:hypothetical protein
MKIKLAKLWADNFRVLSQTAVNDAERCAEYAGRPTPMPPISVSQAAATIIYDGLHRTVAASIRGETEIEVVLVFG